MSPSRTPRLWLAILVEVAVAGALLYALSGLRTRTVFESDSEFGRVRVTEQSDGLRSLYTGDGRARQSAIYPGRPLQLVHEYTRVGMIGLALVPADARILFVGLGGGAMPMYTRQLLPRAHIHAVEIDPVIVAAAERWFGFVPDDRMTVHTGDGRAFIEQSPPGTYDLVVLDAFSDDEVPYSLTTREFLQAVRRIMTPHGVVISNLWTAQASYAAMLATYDDVLDHVQLIRVPGRAQRILVASMQSRPLDRRILIDAARALESRVDLGFPLTSLIEQGHETPPRAGASVLVDRAPR
jgi:spermidine synthase